MMDINEVFESNDFATDMIASKGLEVKKHIFFKLVNGEDNGVSLNVMVLLQKSGKNIFF